MPELEGTVNFFSGFSQGARVLMASGAALIAIGALIVILTPLFAQRGSNSGTSATVVDYGAAITSPRKEQGSPLTFNVILGENAVEAMNATNPEERIEFWYVTTNTAGDKYWPQTYLTSDSGPPWTIEVEWPLKGVSQDLATVILFAADKRAKLALNLRKRGDIKFLSRDEIYVMAGMRELGRVSIMIKEDL